MANPTNSATRRQRRAGQPARGLPLFDEPSPLAISSSEPAIAARPSPLAAAVEPPLPVKYSAETLAMIRACRAMKNLDPETGQPLPAAVTPHQTDFDPLSPPAAPGSATSAAAARSVADRVESDAVRILDWLRRAGGATNEQVSEATGIFYPTCCARMNGLWKAGKVRKSNRTRMTTRLREATVWEPT